jgi:hypothetical protein
MDRNVSVSTRARRRHRVLAGAGAAALAVSSLALVAMPAGAAPVPKPKGKTTCTTSNGTVTGTIQIGGCTDSNGANTGGSSVAFPTSNLTSGGVITWASGKTTTLGPPTVAATNSKKCPGYVKVKRGQPPVPEPIAFKVSGAVIADTSGMKIPGKYKGAVCIAADGNTITALKAFKYN